MAEPASGIDSRHPETDPETTILRDVNITQQLRPGSIFPAPAPLHVDVGCGKGRFLVARAQACPRINFLGIDRQLVRLRKIDKKLRRAGMHNVRLLRLEADYALSYLLPPGSVNVMYILFPDHFQLFLQ